MFSYQFHIRDYLTKTRHLTLLEDLAYRRLIDTYYTEEQPLPADPARAARLIAMPDNVDEVTAVLDEFFTLEDSGWTNQRCDFEITKYHGKADSARRANKAKVEKKSLKSELVTELKPEPFQDATSKPKNQRTSKPSISLVGFESFWSSYPRKTAKAEALKAFTKINPDEQTLTKMVAAVERSKLSTDWTKDNGQFIPFPSTWLNQRRWEDETEEAASVTGGWI
jgi:uncharacterized protein YdaU (DUF1376 family)